MKEKKYVFALYEGFIHEGGGVTDIYEDKEKAIKFALMTVEEKNKRAVNVHKEYADVYSLKEQFSEFYGDCIVKCWASTIEEVIIYKYEVL